VNLEEGAGRPEATAVSAHILKALNRDDMSRGQKPRQQDHLQAGKMDRRRKGKEGAVNNAAHRSQKPLSRPPPRLPSASSPPPGAPTK